MLVCEANTHPADDGDDDNDNDEWIRLLNFDKMLFICSISFLIYFFFIFPSRNWPCAIDFLKMSDKFDARVLII